MRKIKVIIKRPDEKVGHVATINNTLENLQEIVGGHIETVRLTKDAVIVCNEEGKIRGLEKNFIMGRIVPDVFVGTVIVAGTKADDFTDINFDLGTWKYLLDKWGNDTE